MYLDGPRQRRPVLAGVDPALGAAHSRVRGGSEAGDRLGIARSAPSRSDGVSGLVEQDVHATGQDHGRCDSPSLFLRLTPERDPLRLELGDGGRDVVALERELVARLVARVDGELGRRECEDQPPLPRVDSGPADRIGEDGAECVGLRRVDQCMDSGDGHVSPPERSSDLSSPLSSRARRASSHRRPSTPSARTKSATWRLRRGSPPPRSRTSRTSSRTSRRS